MVREYVGARYVPIFCGEWDTTMQTTYEPLSIVTVPNVGSYTSKKFVPVGISITNTEYWALSGSISGQYDALEQRVTAVEGDVNDITTNDIPALQGDVSNLQIDVAALTAKYGDIAIDPDDYSDATDAGKIQHAVDDATAIAGASDATARNVVILIKREYDISGHTIYLKNKDIWPHSKGSGGFITFLGVGNGGFYRSDIGYSRDDNNYMFAKDPSITSGFVYRHRFINLRFTGPDTQFSSVGYPDPSVTGALDVNEHAAALKIDSLSWTYVENCYFSNLSYAFDGYDVSDLTKVTVGLYCSNNQYMYMAGVFRGGAHYNAIFFDHEEIGLCWTAFNFGNGNCNVFVVRDSIIEYMAFYNFQFGNSFKGTNVTIEGNYLEGCATGVMNMGTGILNVLNFNNNMVEIAGPGTDVNSFGLRVNCKTTTRVNINGNLFNARSDSAAYAIGASDAPAGNANICTGNMFTGGGSGYVNLQAALNSYITLQ